MLLLLYCLFLGITYGWVLVDKGKFLSPDIIGYAVGVSLGYLAGGALYVILASYVQESEK